MPSNHLILCRPLLLSPSIFASIRVFSNKSVLHIRGQRIGVSASTSVLPMNNLSSGQISFRMDWLDLLEIQGTLKSLLQHHSSKASILRRSAFFMVQLSHPYMTTGKTIALTRWSLAAGLLQGIPSPCDIPPGHSGPPVPSPLLHHCTKLHPSATKTGYSVLCGLASWVGVLGFGPWVSVSASVASVFCMFLSWLSSSNVEVREEFAINGFGRENMLPAGFQAHSLIYQVSEKLGSTNYANHSACKQCLQRTAA